MFKNKKGFTLIELLVVIAIIGILASIVLTSLNSARRKGRDARRIADIKQLQLALEMYFDTNSSYPATASWKTDLAPNYIPVAPNDPLNYSYTYEGCTATLYHIGAVLEEASNPALINDLNGPPSGCTGNWGADAACSGTPGLCTTPGLCCYDISP